MKKIWAAKTDLSHLVYLFILFGLITPIIVIQLFPMTLMMFRNQVPVLSTNQQILWVCSAIILTGPFILYKIIDTQQKQQFSKTKNYLLLSLFILALSLAIVLFNDGKF